MFSVSSCLSHHTNIFLQTPQRGVDAHPLTKKNKLINKVKSKSTFSVRAVTEQICSWFSRWVCLNSSFLTLPDHLQVSVSGDDTPEPGSFTSPQTALVALGSVCHHVHIRDRRPKSRTRFFSALFTALRSALSCVTGNTGGSRAHHTSTPSKLMGVWGSH